MTKNPQSTLFWNDLENDEKLKTCSLAAKGLWTCHLLAIAARSPLRGVVLIGAWPCKVSGDLPKVLANMVGGTPAMITELLDELIGSGAASVDDEGRLYNRRMVRERHLSEARSAAGKAGAAAKWAKDAGWQTDGKHHGKADGNDDGKSDALSAEKQKTIPDGASKTACEGDGKPMHSSLLQDSKKEITRTESLVSGALADGSPPPKNESRGTRLPEGWRPEGELRQWTLDIIAEKQSSVSAGHELERFCDYWRAQAGAKGRKADWSATWRNWIRKAIDMEGKGNGPYRGGNAQRRNRTDEDDPIAAGIRESLARRHLLTDGG